MFALGSQREESGDKQLEIDLNVQRDTNLKMPNTNYMPTARVGNRAGFAMLRVHVCVTTCVGALDQWVAPMRGVSRLLEYRFNACVF